MADVEKKNNAVDARTKKIEKIHGAAVKFGIIGHLLIAVGFTVFFYWIILEYTDLLGGAEVQISFWSGVESIILGWVFLVGRTALFSIVDLFKETEGLV